MHIMTKIILNSTFCAVIALFPTIQAVTASSNTVVNPSPVNSQYTHMHAQTNQANLYNTVQNNTEIYDLLESGTPTNVVPYYSEKNVLPYSSSYYYDYDASPNYIGGTSYYNNNSYNNWHHGSHSPWHNGFHGHHGWNHHRDHGHGNKHHHNNHHNAKSHHGGHHHGGHHSGHHGGHKK